MKQKTADQIVKDFDSFVEPNASAPMTDHWKLKSVLSKMETRDYPSCCLSWSCGCSGSDCNDTCKNKKTLNAFYVWKEKHKAVCLDETWARNHYTATI